MRRGSGPALAAYLLIAAAAASGCSPSPSREPAPAVVPPPTATPVPTDELSGTWRAAGAPEALASGLDAPWSVVPHSGGGALISQRDDGAIVELTPAGEIRGVGTVAGIVSGGESGLHGLALHSSGGTEWLYAYHGAREDNRVVRMPLLGEPGGLALGDAEVVFDGIP